MPGLDDVLRDAHSCHEWRRCTHLSAPGYPAATEGRLAGRRADVMLLGWNPPLASQPHAVAPPYEAWREEAASALERAASGDNDWTRRVRPLLPDGVALDDGRVLHTHVWKWPTRLSTGSEYEQAQAARCAARHLWGELGAVRPRVLVTYDSFAARFMEHEALRRGVEVLVPPPPLKSAEMTGWAEPSLRWGWRMGLVLVNDARGRYHPDTTKWARETAARLLARPA